jgi:O-antigen/teichoic acid export membrane protein
VNSKITRISSLQIFQLLRFATLFLIGMVFTKSALTTSEIGQYETFLFLAGAVSFFWLNGLIQGFLPISTSAEKNEKSPLLFNVFYLISAFSSLAALFLIVFQHALSGHVLHHSPVPFLQLLVVYILITSPASLVEYIYLIKNQARRMLTYGVISFGLMFILVAVPPVFGFGLEYSMAGLLISSAFRYIWMLVLLFRNSKPDFDPAFVKKHLRSAWPLIFSMLLSGSGPYIDGLIITSWFDDARFAIFRYGAREFPLVLLLANAFSTSMLPDFADGKKLKNNLEKIRLNAERLGNWLFPVSGILMLIAHWAFPFIFNVGFSESATIFNIYLLLIISRLMFPQTILIGLQKTRAIMWASFLEIILNVALSLWFLQYWGMNGVAYGTVVAYLFEKLFLMVYVRKNCGFRINEYLKVNQHIFYSVILLAEYFVVEFLIFN